jgi:hypothetical protein
MEKLPTRIDLIKRLPAGALVAEVGVWRGYFSSEILNHTSVGKLFLVDAWKRQVWSKHEQQSDIQHEKDLAECKHHIRGHLASGRVQIVRGTSAEVALHDRTIPPLDAVFIDACHEYDFVTEDLINWSKRLKPDGVLMGHDFTDTHPNAIKWGFGVVPAVKDFCAKYGWEIVTTTEEDFPSYELRRLPNWTGAEL